MDLSFQFCLRVVEEATMGDRDVTEVKGRLAKLYSELDEINAQEKIRLEEMDKMTALHTAKLEEARVLSGRYAVGNDQPDERIIEEDRGGDVAICGADAGNGDKDQNQEGNADDEAEDDEDEDYDDEDVEDYDAEDVEDYDAEDDENEENAEDEVDKDEEAAEDEDEDD
ncbi:phosphopantothenoylcysteine decarboxylase subunit VHS3-like [Chenopodium quinoa]|uniref:phosphopantothenoylcysteine decarboxylase subunit VHS3-like n=1 Tax=Chenopodium quinoa TaxID=63459 RepID=UPI000B76D2A9|nr:phosphopantothenoylcysteine decarboxylase subunit VHS3-like [Chenopodium quinoa]